MDQENLFKQMTAFQKAAFDNSFKAVVTFQEQGEKMTDVFLNQASWLPEEGKEAITSWIDTYKKGLDSFRDAVEENFNKVQEHFADPVKQAEI